MDASHAHGCICIQYIICPCPPNVQVTSVDMFEALALSAFSPPTEASSATSSHDDLPEGVRFRCGAGALVPPPFEPKRAAVRVHAVSAPPPRRQLGPDDEGGRPGDPVHVEYQIVIENVGAVPVEVLGRCASLLCVGSIRVSLH